MSLHAGPVKKLLQGQIIIAKVTLERAPYGLPEFFNEILSASGVACLVVRGVSCFPCVVSAVTCHNVPRFVVSCRPLDAREPV